MRRRRRRALSRKIYSLAYLLSRQPKTLTKHRQYPLLMSYFYASARLQDLRISRQCYTVLNQGKVHPDHLNHFYLTHGLPKEPFFPLFLKIKRDYERERERKQEERHEYLLESMRRLPEGTRAFIKYLGYLEAHYHSRGRYPLWQQHIFPATKKQAQEYHTYTQLQWMELFRDHLLRLQSRYPGMSSLVVERLIACFLLEWVPEELPPRWPPATEITARYRRLSLRHHPDLGGDPRVFVYLKGARDVLLS